MKRILIILGIVILVPTILFGCTNGGEIRKEIDGKPYKVTRPLLFGLIPLPGKLEPILTPAQKEAEREDEQKDFEQKVKQETILQKLWRQKWITILICACLTIGAVAGLIAIVTQKVGLFSTISIAGFIMSFVLGVVGNLLKIAHSPWMMVIVGLLVLLFVAFRKFSAFRHGKRLAETGRDKFKGWIAREGHDEDERPANKP